MEYYWCVVCNNKLPTTELFSKYEFFTGTKIETVYTHSQCKQCITKHLSIPDLTQPLYDFVPETTLALGKLVFSSSYNTDQLQLIQQYSDLGSKEI